MLQLRTTLALALFALLSACSTLPAATPQASGRTYTILLSIDGFRPDYLDRGQTPTLSRLAADGVRGAMRPSFPSITFPNHYTLVTGLRPDKHGVIYNRMEDPAHPGVVFALNAPAITSQSYWWEDATPIWVTAENQNVRTGTMFWPGSDAAIHGVRPSRYRLFDQSLTGFARVDQVLSWMDLPETERPTLYTLYFDIVDTSGHRYGPDSPDTTASAAEVDAAMARLVAGLEARGLRNRVNLVITADHGMSSMPENQNIDLDVMAAAGALRVVWDGPFAGIEAQPGRDGDLDAVVGRREHGECWRKANLPARFQYGTHRRIPAIICVADRGWRYRTASIPAYAGPAAGNHGFDIADPEMEAIFIANGPAFRRGVTLPTFDNVSVYPLIAQLAGVRPEANDGDIADVAAALR
jgi:predicted AlkP superfamily pyrophosphatase or phosphodiesterase